MKELSSERLTATVFILMRNEENFVRQCLDSILIQLGNRQDIEILCVEGFSTDRTRPIIEEYCIRDSRVRLVDNPSGTTPAGMNLAIQSARGLRILCLGCHAEYGPDYIDKSIEVLDRTGADVVGGYITTAPAYPTPIGKAIAAATSSFFGVGGARFRTGGKEQEADTVAFGCYRRDVFTRFGIFDERLVRNQDIEHSVRIRSHGGHILASPEIQLTYFNRSTYSGICQQAFNNGLWNPYTLYLVGGGLRLRHFVPLGFVLSIIGGIALGFLWWPVWAILGVEVAGYLLAAAWFSHRATKKQKANPFLVVLAFVQLHLSYGVGSLWGVLSAPFKFGLRPKRNTL